MGTAVLQNALDGLTAQADPLQLIYRKDVQRDLGLDLGQRNKLDNFHDEQAAAVRQARMSNPRNPAAVSDLLGKQRGDTQKKIDELLTAPQKDRLKQIGLQLQGNAAILNPEIQKQLDLSGDQLDRIRQIQSQREARIAELQANVSQGSVLPQDISILVPQIQTETDASYAAVLSPEQVEQLKKLLGRPFKPSKP